MTMLLEREVKEKGRDNIGESNVGAKGIFGYSFSTLS
jgi:hypothetical protein